ncbi:LOW QUALITY PROTEIN: potassium channel subfamily K member 6-like [Dermochelys coriacea]|uniref:LOW QUALITY PROTEIN: potassium channel subfamily K member 6-like n=1 Tax=Dermochelys coriacea TaxID=27794 RepID=UPI0018E8E80D|nr:LOW QUALITY PROTEIN: potassium channel subfamily K member 6-like [Dermochelys coriacea]
MAPSPGNPPPTRGIPAIRRGPESQPAPLGGASPQPKKPLGGRHGSLCSRSETGPQGLWACSREPAAAAGSSAGRTRSQEASSGRGAPGPPVPWGAPRALPGEPRVSPPRRPPPPGAPGLPCPGGRSGCALPARAPGARGSGRAMNRCAVQGLCLLGYAGYLLLGALLVSAIERPYESRLRAELRSLKAAFLRASPCLNESALEALWRRVLSANSRYGVSVLGGTGSARRLPAGTFASAFFLQHAWSPPLGYGYTTPLSDSGKAFCIFYALLGVPFTMLVLTATVQRLARLFVHRPLEYLQLRLGYSHQVLAQAHFLLLLLAVLVAFFLLPAAIFSALEETWSYLDAFYFCFISLCTIGLGDYVPGEQPGQKLRALYKVSVTVYLLLGLMAVLLVLQTFHKAADLHGLTDLFLLPADRRSDQEPILQPEVPPEEPAQGEKPTPASAQLNTGSRANYSSISR